jgi:hypothetical protein
VPYCYACRNSKPARHSHFTDYGALALRPPKRHITAIEAQWDTLSGEARAQALATGRQLLAQAGAYESTPAPRPRTASSSPRTDTRAARPRVPRASAQEGKGEKMRANDWAWVGGSLAVIAAPFALLWWIARNAGESA